MRVSQAAEKLVRLALSRHDDGIPDLHIFFDEEGDEVPWKVVADASPKATVGQMEAVSPRPGVGYFLDLHLEGSEISGDGQTHRFRIRSPNVNEQLKYVERPGAAAYVTSISTADPDTQTVLGKIDSKL